MQKTNISTSRIIGMLLGCAVISLGIAFFKQSGLGNDSITALNLRAAELLGISLGTMNLMANTLFFIAEILWGRKYIGLGTFFNWVAIGYMVTFFYQNIEKIFGVATSFPIQFVFVLLGVVVISIGVSMYQTANLGIAPYDYLAIGIADHTPFPYFGCRIFTDALTALITFLLGGLIGLGTLICAFGLGPFISFFDTHFSRKWIR